LIDEAIMALSAFDDKAKPPTESEIQATLGKTHALWNQLQEFITAKFAPVTVEWGYTSKSTGWGIRLRTDKRTILYMTPCEGYFLASFALGEKAVRAAQGSKLPLSILASIDSAKKYAEGRGVRLEIRTVRDLHSVETLAIVKMAN
jgi:hypothetical protein